MRMERTNKKKKGTKVLNWLLSILLWLLLISSIATILVIIGYAFITLFMPIWEVSNKGIKLTVLLLLVSNICLCIDLIAKYSRIQVLLHRIECLKKAKHNI